MPMNPDGAGSAIPGASGVESGSGGTRGTLRSVTGSRSLQSPSIGARMTATGFFMKSKLHPGLQNLQPRYRIGRSQTRHGPWLVLPTLSPDDVDVAVHVRSRADLPGEKPPLEVLDDVAELLRPRDSEPLRQGVAQALRKAG